MGVTRRDRSRGNRPRRDPLSRERIVAATLALVEREGAGALTMRAVGAELGVEAMSLYHYFPDKGALVDGAVQALAEEIEIPAVGSVPWEEASRAIVRAFRDVSRRFPNASQLLLVRERPADEAVIRSQGALDHLLSAGFGETTARYAYRALSAYAWGSLVEDRRARSPFTTGDRDEEFEFGLDALIAGLDRLRGPRRR